MLARSPGVRHALGLDTGNHRDQRIDEIISLVSTEQMPLGGPYLSDEEIVLIRAWKHGGFQ